MSEKVVRFNLIDCIVPNSVDILRLYLFERLKEAGWKNGQEITHCYNGRGVVEYRFNVESQNS